MAQRGCGDHRVPLGDITNSQSRQAGSRKTGRVSENNADQRAVRRKKARDRYANMPPEKKAELNAKKRQDYHRKQAEKPSVGL
ncbi:hypothetical protein PVAP13_8KG259502 [Panicum virgatum]|uniref:Uncharacterized protein n=1 Tax=Panicum virgatum TaxID=38727 RepID=A0A8T0PMU2_PANVG|nr:hypothetical protein PVAP13_8KG259502 [Panicum virgatum]